MRNLLKKHTLTFAMIIGAVVSILVAGFTAFATECERIPEEVLRLHILAESNSYEDQRFKYELRDYILENFTQEFVECDTLASAKQTGRWLLPEIESTAQQFADEKNYITKINAEITKMYFPTRVYSNQTLPAGNYTALRVTIGEGEGDNWWCVMFPLLCVPAVSESEQEVTSAIALPEVVDDVPQVKFAVFEVFARWFK